MLTTQPNPTENVFALRVSLQQESADRLSAAVDGPEGESAPEKLGRLASTVLTDLSQGGMLVDPDTMFHISECVKPASISFGKELLPYIETATHHRGSGTVLDVVLDPIWMGPLEQIAERRGETVRSMVQKCFEQAMAMGWFFEIEPPPHRTFLIEQRDVVAIAEVLGRSPEELTGTDLATFIKEEALPVTINKRS